MPKKIDLFIDSGAFSAKSQGIEISLDEYIEFIKKNERYISIYANLDVIGDPAETWKNQKYMESKGLNPLPCYHIGEPKKWLKRYMKNYDYIALGGMVSESRAELTLHLDEIWEDILTDDEGHAKLKVHGFGLSGLRTILRYPWYSVDSTTWLLTSRIGEVYIPKARKDGEWDYQNSMVIQVSGRSSDRNVDDKHINLLPPRFKKIVFEYIEEMGFELGSTEYKTVKPGYELKENERWAERRSGDKKKEKKDRTKVEVIVKRGISNDYYLRDRLSIKFFLGLEKSLPDWKDMAFKKKMNSFDF